MAYYTERNGIRKPRQKTYDLDTGSYTALLNICKDYYKNLIWKYHMFEDKNKNYSNIKYDDFISDVIIEIPSIRLDSRNSIIAPNTLLCESQEEANDILSSIFDFIEYMAKNIKDYQIIDYDGFVGNETLKFTDTCDVFNSFQNQINQKLNDMFLLYRLNDNKEMARIVENSPLTETVEKTVLSIKESGTKELLKEAIELHKSTSPTSARDAAEKIWDAFERLKTYYSSDKKQSANKIVSDISNGSSDFKTLIEAEFKALTDIGNGYRIRHHETDKIDITDIRHYDYFFNRCLSLIALAVQYLE